MQVIKCKSCGANLPMVQQGTIVQCDHCGVTQTIPKPDSEKKLSAFARANKLRMAGEFDKAAGVYEGIVADYPEEAEAYWGLVLCKYGVEYVDDPATGKKVPTCHRSSYDSVLDDDDFEQALENSSPEVRAQYREEAKFLESLRKRIVEVSSKEEPYDIFISYKETDFNGERTVDSVLAQDIYQMLTKKGYRVFFSRISLKEHLGKEYEPYIFAALNSAKVMLVVGTDYEYFNAPWVKNEWSRYLQLIAKGEKKTLIPCYKNVGIDDMPKEFAVLQAQNIGVVGYMQDLESGIEKLLPLEAPNAAAPVVQANAVATTDSYLKRARQFLADGDFIKADEYAERVLDIEPDNANAYLCKLLVEYRAVREEDLARAGTRLDVSKHYAKILRYGDKELGERLQRYNEAIVERIGVHNARLQEAESKKQAVVREIAHAEKLVGDAEMKCNAIQSAINQKGQYLTQLSQNIQNLKQEHEKSKELAKSKHPILMLFVSIICLVICGGSLIGYMTELFNGYIAGFIAFATMAVGGLLLVLLCRAVFGEAAGLPLGLAAFIPVVLFVIALCICHDGPFGVIFALLDKILIFWEDNTLFPVFVWMFTWVVSSVLYHLIAMLLAVICFFGSFAKKKKVKSIAKQIQQAIAEYEAKVKNDEELSRLHAELDSAKAAYSNTMDACRASIQARNEEYLRAINACHMKAEALIPGKFK